MPGPRGPLSVRVHDGVEARTVTRHVSGLKFTKVADGGHQACSMRLNLPTSAFADLGPSDRLWIDDTRTGRNLFSAYTQNPTPTDGPAGQSFDLAALGGMILAADETRALVYIDRDLGQFERDPGSAADSDSNAAKDETYTGDLRLRTQFSGGSVVGTGAVASATNSLFSRSDMNLGGLYFGAVYSGRSDAGYAEDVAVFPGTIIQTRTMGAVGVTLAMFVGEVIPADTRIFGVQLRRTGGATNVTDDTTWTNWVNYIALGQRLDRFGNPLTGPAGMRSVTDVRASEVFEDLVGRLLTAVDPTRVVIEPTTMPIGQLSFPDGATAQRVADELGEFEADMQWGIGSDDGLPASAGGRGHEAWYRRINPAPRYEITTADTYRQTGSEVDLCNRVSVQWTDPAGTQQTTVVTATSDQYPALRALEDAGRTRDADPITLPDGKGSANNALIIGHQILAAKASPPRSATAVVTRYVRDLWTGADIHPCELEPGCMVQIRATGEVIYCTQTDHDDEAGSTTLTLGDPVPTDSQRFARLSVA